MDLAKILDLRQRVLRGEPTTDEELNEAIRVLRAGREAASAATSSSKSSTKKPAVKVDISSLFGKKADEPTH